MRGLLSALQLGGDTPPNSSKGAKGGQTVKKGLTDGKISGRIRVGYNNLRFHKRAGRNDHGPPNGGENPCHFLFCGKNSGKMFDKGDKMV